MAQVVDVLVHRLAEELERPAEHVATAVALLDEGHTLPFLARYRKEATGGMDEVVLERLQRRLEQLRALEARRETVLRSLAEQGVLTPELEAQIRAAETLQALEDLYLPYRPKRRTRASVARERGLEPLARWMWDQAAPSEADRLALAAPFVDPEKEVPDPEAALAGARDIVAEWIAEAARVRGLAREILRLEGTLESRVVHPERDPKGVYRLYYDFRRPLSELRPHQVLALDRGERERVLRVEVAGPEEEILWRIERLLGPCPTSALSEDRREALVDAWRRLLLPSLARELRRELREAAHAHAIRIFRRNLRALLLQPPLRGATVLGIDPGYRSGCKLAVVGPTGRLLGGATVYPHKPRNRWKEAQEILARLVRKHRVTAIAIGNGTASRETERWVAATIREHDLEVAYTVVNEAGASVYSTSPEARREFPRLDASQRGAISIARRLLDPLAELVKVPPRSLGVGLYQHDVDPKELDAALEREVVSVVSGVGVDLNTASAALLRYVAGIGPALAERIVAWREEHGPFRRREELRQVPGLGPKTFLQCAGFLRIPDGEEPLDNTAVHPEAYPAVRRLIERYGDPSLPLPEQPARIRARLAEEGRTLAEVAAELGLGVPTLQDVLEALARPGRDPRDDLPPPVLRHDVLSLEDLKPGMVLEGIVRNVVDFGAFVDLGVGTDGLIHRTELSYDRHLHPLEVVQVGQRVRVMVLEVDVARERIALTMKGIGELEVLEGL